MDNLLDPSALTGDNAGGAGADALSSTGANAGSSADSAAASSTATNTGAEPANFNDQFAAASATGQNNSPADSNNSLFNDNSSESSLPDPNAQPADDAAAAAAADPNAAPPPSEDDEIAELQAFADNPLNSKSVRDRISKAIELRNKAREEYSRVETELSAAREQVSAFEGRQVVDEQSLQRYQQAENLQLRLSSFAAKPDEIRNAIREINPRVYNDFVVDTVWNALEREDGTPDFENLQTIVDRFSGYTPESGEPRVAAKDVIEAIEALKAGRIEPYQLHEFASEAEREAFTRQRALEQQTEQNRQRYEQELATQETHARNSVIHETLYNSTVELQQQRIAPLMSKFKLDYVDGEPPELREFKENVRREISNISQRFQNEHPSFKEIRTALDILGKPANMATAQAQAEVRNYLQSQAFTAHFGKATSDMMTEIEQTITRNARMTRLLALGLEEDVRRVAAARQHPAAGGNQGANPGNAPANLAGQSRQQHNAHVSQQVSANLRAAQNPQARNNFG